MSNALAAIAEHDAASQWTRAAVLSSIGGRLLSFVGAVIARKDFIKGAQAQVWIDEVAFLVGNTQKQGDEKAFLERLGAANVGSQRNDSSIAWTWTWGGARGGSLRPLLSGDSALLAKQLLVEAEKVAAGKARSGDRLPAIRLLGLVNPVAARQLLPELLDARQPSAVQLGALQTMAGVLDRGTCGSILERWQAMSPPVRREATEVLCSQVVGIDALLEALEWRRFTASEIDPGRLQHLAEHSSPEIRARAQKILASGVVASRDRAAVVKTYQPAIKMAGERERGAQCSRRYVQLAIRRRGVASTWGRTWRR